MGETKQTIGQDDASFMEEFAGQGFEGMRADELVRPFLKILQKDSPECEEDSPAHVEGAKPGLFYNTVRKFIYGPSIEMIVLHFEHMWLAWEPDRGGLRGVYEPDTIPVKGDQWSGRKDEDGNDVKDYFTFMVALPQYPSHGILAFSMYSTGIPHAKKWNQLQLDSIVQIPQPDGTIKEIPAPRFAYVWKLDLELNRDTKYSWYQVGVKGRTAIQPVRQVSKAELYNIILPQRKMLSTTHTDYKQLTDETDHDYN